MRSVPPGPETSSRSWAGATSIESIHDGKAEDRETLRRIAREDRGAGPEGAGEAPERELGLKLE